MSQINPENPQSSQEQSYGNEEWWKLFREGEWDQFINQPLPVLTSSVVKRQDVYPWYDDGYLIPHEPLRRDLINAARLLQPKYFDGLVNWKVQNFFKWYKDFCFIVHDHHTAEEKIVFPTIAKRAPIPDKVSADHKELLVALEEVGKYEKKFTGSDEEKKKAATDLYLSWKKLVELMLPHLEEEEEVVIPILKEKMTEPEFKQMIDTIIKSLGLNGNAVMLPWITHGMQKWGGQRAVSRFLADVPKPIVMLHNRVWIHQHQYRQDLLFSLERDQDPKLEFPGFWGLMFTGKR